MTFLAFRPFYHDWRLLKAMQWRRARKNPLEGKSNVINNVCSLLSLFKRSIRRCMRAHTSCKYRLVSQTYSTHKQVSTRPIQTNPQTPTNPSGSVQKCALDHVGVKSSRLEMYRAHPSTMDTQTPWAQPPAAVFFPSRFAPLPGAGACVH